MSTRRIKSTAAQHRTVTHVPAGVAIAAVLGIVFALFIDTVSIELHCDGGSAGNCRMSHQKLGVKKGMLGLGADWFPSAVPVHTFSWDEVTGW
jgi:hypothetical protein